MQYIDEIKQQPEALRDLTRHYFIDSGRERAMRETLKKEAFDQVIFVGMGSSLYAAYTAAGFLREKGVRAFAMECGEFLYHDAGIVDERTLVVAVSQSGKSPEVVGMCREYAAKKDWKLAIVTNYPENTLYQYGQYKFLIYAGEEFTTASKTYTNTIAALLYLSCLLADWDESAFQNLYRDLLDAADKMEELIESSVPEIESMCESVKERSAIYAVGSGPSYSSASYAEMIMEEAGKIYASRFTCNQFLHGPVELINESFCTVLFDFYEKSRPAVEKIIKLVGENGGSILLITNRKEKYQYEKVHQLYIEFDNPCLSPLVEIIPVELIVNQLGLYKGLKPGRLKWVEK